MIVLSQSGVKDSEMLHLEMSFHLVCGIGTLKNWTFSQLKQPVISQTLSIRFMK